MSTSPETVGFWPRVWAFVVDTTCMTLLLLPLSLLVYGLTFYLSGRGWIDFALHFGLPFVLVFWFWKRWLATPGKMLIPAEIVDARTLAAPSSGQLVIRYLGYFISVVPLGLGMLWILVDPRHQGWHDKLAGTLVIRRQHSTISPRTARIIHLLSGVVAVLLIFATIGIAAWTVSAGPGLLGSYRQLQEAVDDGTVQGIMGSTRTCWNIAWNQGATCQGALCALRDSFFLRSCLNSARPEEQTCRRVITDPTLSIETWQARCQELSRPGTPCTLLVGTLSIYCRGLR